MSLEMVPNKFVGVLIWFVWRKKVELNLPVAVGDELFYNVRSMRLPPIFD
jgi:hypothetical protein